MEPVFLRPLELDDLHRTHNWHNNQCMYDVMGGSYHFVNHAENDHQYQTTPKDSLHEIHLAICLREDSTHIGNIYLRNIDWIARHAEVAIFIGEITERGKGYGTAAHKLLLQYTFDELGLVRLYTFIQEGTSALKMAIKYGFVKEGTMRKQGWIDGEFKDFAIMAICKKDQP